MKLWGLIAIATVLTATGCGRMNETMRRDQVMQRARFDLECPSGEVSIQSLSSNGSSYGVTGCERVASYVLIDCADGWHPSVCKVNLNSLRSAGGSTAVTPVEAE